MDQIINAVCIIALLAPVNLIVVAAFVATRAK